MSDQQPAKPGGPKSRHNPFVTLLMFLVGVILLLPGLCSVLILGITVIQDGFRPQEGGLPVLIFGFFFCSLLGAGGVALIIHAYRR